MTEEQWQEWKRAEAERHRQEREDAEEAEAVAKLDNPSALSVEDLQSARRVLARACRRLGLK